MLKLKKQQKYNKNNMCLGEIIKGNDINDRVYYYEEKDDDEKDNEIDLDEKLTAKYVRGLKTDISLNDIRTIEKFIRGRIKELPDELKELYNLIIDEKTKESNKQLRFNDSEFLCCPDIDIDIKEPFVKSNHIYVAGSSGCGKSYWISNYLKLINKYQKKRDIFIFSDVEFDDAFDKGIKNVQRIALNERLIDDPIEPEELKDSVCVFDDIDSIQNKQLKNTVYTLMNSLYRRGRHENITCISSTHNITDYTKSRVPINESSLIVLFCRSGSTAGQKYILERYCGLDKSVIKDIMNIKSRSVQIHKSYPQFYSWNKGIKII
jgi:hypothetical protein